MTVLSAVRQKQHLTLVTLTGGEEVLLDNDICSLNAVKPGTELTEERLSELKYESEYERAKSRALWYLDRADRTEKSMYEKLVTAGLDKRASAAAIARLKEVGLIDDRRYAERFAERCLEGNISKRETLSKMLAKGVPYDIAKEILEDTEADEEEQIKNVIEKKYLRKLQTENGTERVYAALIRRGFSFSAVRKVLSAYSEELSYDV